MEPPTRVREAGPPTPGGEKDRGRWKSHSCSGQTVCAARQGMRAHGTPVTGESGSLITPRRGWRTSCKDGVKLGGNSVLTRKSDTIRGTEESCLALATGLWQEETVSRRKEQEEEEKEDEQEKKKQTAAGIVLKLFSRFGTTSRVTMRRSGSVRTMRSCGKLLDLNKSLLFQINFCNYIFISQN